MAKRVIGIIGAGPAGIFAALEAKKSGAEVLLFDSNDRIGRKLLVTGSGRCNLTNAGVKADKYACGDPEFVGQALAQFGHLHLLKYLDELGILTYATSDGWFYPISNSAANVVDTLEMALLQAGIILHLGKSVSEFHQKGNRFRIIREDQPAPIEVDRLIVASGGKAYPTLGSTGHLLPILSQLGHIILPVEPALGPVLTDPKPFHKIQGVRLDAGLTLFEGQHRLGQTIGNIIFTQWGLNGPGIMDLSHLVSLRPGKKLHLEIDFIAASEDSLLRWLKTNRQRSYPLRIVLGAVMPAKVPPLLLELANLPVELRLDQITDPQLDRFLKFIRSIPLDVQGTRGFEYCQLSTGGVNTYEVDPLNMESRLVKNLYLAGETLDVIGPCGGYNLQWAFSSGVIAGRAAGRE